MPAISIKHIYVKATPNAIKEECIRESILLALENDKTVELDFHGSVFFINPSIIIRSALQNRLS